MSNNNPLFDEVAQEILKEQRKKNNTPQKNEDLNIFTGKVLFSVVIVTIVAVTLLIL